MVMPTTKTINEALRNLGWSPAGVDASVSTVAWTHPMSIVVIRVPRTDFIDSHAARRIINRARRAIIR
jgi:hypothetical protein